MIHGLAYFPGINQIVDGTISFGVGNTPSAATLTIAPQPNFTAQVGDLVFIDSVNTSITWPKARLDTNSFERNQSGLVWQLTIYDRRWMWQSVGGGGLIKRGINLRNDDGTLIEYTRMTCQEAASLCLDAMGEVNYDVSRLPNEEYPELFWDSALPAQSLEELCDQLGCYVVLGLDNRVSIHRVGIGNALPDTPEVLTNSLGLMVPGLPSELGVVCVPDRFQIDGELEAVGIENDGKGTLKRINDLSYKPAGGWELSEPEFIEDIENVRDRNLALQSVFRYYRLKLPVTVFGYTDSAGVENAAIFRPWHLKLEDVQVEYIDEDRDLPEAERRLKPAQIGGCYYEEVAGKLDNNIDVDDVAPYQTDPLSRGDEDADPEVANNPWHFGSSSQGGENKEHYVVFGKPIYRRSETDDTIRPAKLVLRTACTLLDRLTNAPVRTIFYRKTGSLLNTLTRHESFGDLQVWHRWNYDDMRVIDNIEDVRTDADYYLDGMLQEYQATDAQTITYAGIKYIQLDGSIRNVTYKVGKSGCTTTASRNSEQMNRIQPLTYRKLMSKIKSSLRENRAKRPTLRLYKQKQKYM
jgi:hypothetical protein